MKINGLAVCICASIGTEEGMFQKMESAGCTVCTVRIGTRTSDKIQQNFFRLIFSEAEQAQNSRVSGVSHNKNFQKKTRVENSF